MLNTLYGKLALALAVLLGAIGLSYGLISHGLTQRYLQEAQQRFNRDLARNLVADQKLVAEGKLDTRALKATFERYMTINLRAIALTMSTWQIDSTEYRFVDA